MTRDDHRESFIEAERRKMLEAKTIKDAKRMRPIAGEQSVSTKNDPGKFDCYSKAAPDEPIFVLLARDPLAPDLVRRWAARRSVLDIGDEEKVDEAYSCADAMEQWRATNWPEKKT